MSLVKSAKATTFGTKTEGGAVAVQWSRNLRGQLDGPPSGCWHVRLQVGPMHLVHPRGSRTHVGNSRADPSLVPRAIAIPWNDTWKCHYRWMRIFPRGQLWAVELVAKVSSVRGEGGGGFGVTWNFHVGPSLVFAILEGREGKRTRFRSLRWIGAGGGTTFFPIFPNFSWRSCIEYVYIYYNWSTIHYGMVSDIYNIIILIWVTVNMNRKKIYKIR